MRSLSLLSLLLVLVLTSLVGCAGMPEDSCIARGTKTAIRGSLTTTLTIGSGAPAVESTEDTLAVSDYDRSCTYDQEEFPVQVLGCRVFVRLEPASNHTDDPDPVPAVIVGGQTCTLALPQGQATVSIASGSLAFPGGIPTFTLDGAVGALNGVSTLGSATVVLVAD